MSKEQWRKIKEAEKSANKGKGKWEIVLSQNGDWNYSVFFLTRLIEVLSLDVNITSNEDLGKVGITSFKSRSFAEWQKAGGVNLFPVDPTKVKDASEIPYMQRAGGSADGADLKGGAGKKGPTFIQFGGKKKAPEPEPEKPKAKNWWTLN